MTHFETNHAVIAERIRIVVMAAGGEIRADEFCRETIKRGWALPGLEPEDIGMEEGDTICITIGQRAFS